MGSRRKARECALQMLFAADVAGQGMRADELVRDYWTQLGEPELDEQARVFATRLTMGTLAHQTELDERIRSRAEHWRITRMAVVDRNVLRLAVYEFLHEQTPRTVAINEALEIARRFSTYEATQFINGILDAIKRDLDRERPQPETDEPSPEEIESAADAAAAAPPEATTAAPPAEPSTDAADTARNAHAPGAAHSPDDANNTNNVDDANVVDDTDDGDNAERLASAS